MRWPKGFGPPHLALNPPFFVFVFFSAFCFLGGFKGQVRWPKGPPHLALNPPYFLFVFLFLFFYLLSFLCFFLFNRQKICFPPKKGHFCCSFFWVSLCFFLAFLGPLLFHFLFLCLSLSLSLVLFFLPSFLVLISVSGSCFFFLFRLFFFFFQLFFCFCFSACCLVLFWIIILDLFLLFILFSYSCFFVFVAFICCYFFIFGNQSKTSLKKGIPKTAKMKNAEKKRTFWQEQLAQVCSQIVSFFILCFFQFGMLCWKHYKLGVSAKTKQKKQRNSKVKKLVQVCCAT